MANYIIERQCTNCFTRNTPKNHSCIGCGELLVEEISRDSEEYKTRFNELADQAAKRSQDKLKSELDISDLDPA